MSMPTVQTVFHNFGFKVYLSVLEQDVLLKPLIGLDAYDSNWHRAP